MTPEQFQAMLALLELPAGSTVEDAFESMRTDKATIRMLSEGEDGGEARVVMAAATARLSRLTGAATLGEAVRTVEEWRESHLNLEKAIEQERKERKALEMGEYRKLTGELVKLGAEIPFTAWQDEKGTLPCKRLLDEPLAQLRERVARLAAANKGQRIVALPTSDLTERERAMLEKSKVDPDAYVKIRERINARTTREQQS